VKTIYKFLLGAVLALAASVGLHAQCTLHPGYNDYTTWTFTNLPNASNYSNGTYTVTRQAQLEGTTTVTGLCYATHKPTLNMTLGTHTGTAMGPSLSMTTYIDLPLSLTSNFTVGTDWTSMLQGQIYCSHLAGFIYNTRLDEYFHFAYTWSIAVGPGVPVTKGWQYPVTQYCANGTPDYNPPSVFDGVSGTDYYFVTGAFQARVSQANLWTTLVVPVPPFTITAFPPYPPYPPHICMHTGPQF
jgi:hypothetical protein